MQRMAQAFPDRLLALAQVSRRCFRLSGTRTSSVAPGSASAAASGGSSNGLCKISTSPVVIFSLFGAQSDEADRADRVAVIAPAKVDFLHDEISAAASLVERPDAGVVFVAIVGHAERLARNNGPHLTTGTRPDLLNRRSGVRIPSGPPRNQKATETACHPRSAKLGGKVSCHCAEVF